MAGRRKQKHVDSGRLAREEARRKATEKVLEATDAIIDRQMPYLEDPVLDTRGHDQAITATCKAIDKAFRVSRDHQIARRQLEHRVHRFNEKNDRDLRVLIAPVRFPTDRPRRSAEWCLQRRKLNAFHEALLQALNSVRRPHLSVDEWLGVVLYFAATLGGLSHTRLIEALRDALQVAPDLRAHAGTKRIWIDLYYQSKGACNELVDGNYRVCRRWPVPPICRLPLIAYLTRLGRGEEPAADASVFTLIRSAAATLCPPGLPSMSFRDFCRTGLAIAERQPNADISECLASYASLRLECMSLPANSWEFVLSHGSASGASDD